MLLWKPIPLYTSYGGMTVNGGKVRNEGVEMELGYKFGSGDFRFGLTANASYIKNKVVDQGNDRTGIDGITGGMGGQVTYSENGRPYGFFYGYQTLGVFQNQSEIEDRKSTRLNSSHANISYAVFCLQKKKRPPAGSATLSRSQPPPSSLPCCTCSSRNYRPSLRPSRSPRRSQATPANPQGSVPITAS